MSIEFDLGGVRYRARVLPVVEQWALLRRLDTILPALMGIDLGMRAAGLGVGDAVSVMGVFSGIDDAQMGAVFDACISACERFDVANWVPADRNMRLGDLVETTMRVIAENFSVLFAMRRPDFRPVPRDDPAFEPAGMPDNEDWIWRPVLRGIFKGESLFDGTLRIEHVARANDALDVEVENEARARKAAERSK